MKLGIFLIALGCYGAYGFWLLFSVILKLICNGAALDYIAVSTHLIFPLGIGVLIWFGIKRIVKARKE